MNTKRTSSILPLVFSTGAVLPLIPLSLPAGAQQLEEIIVTAQRREQSVQDIPISISAFTGDQLEVRQIADILDLQFSVPNLLVDGLRTSIRGIGNNAISSTAEAGLGYHVNDVYVNSPLFSTSEYFDIERVEVLRGPQGTLYGRNTTAGVINIHTRKPHDEFGGFVSATAGNYDTLKFKGAINIPLGDRLRQRFAGMYLGRDGYTDNKYTGNDIDGRDQYELRSSTSFDFTDNLSADLVLSYVNEDSDKSFRTKGVCTKDAEYGCSPLSVGTETPNVSSSIFQTINLLLLGGGLFTPGVDYFADSVNPSGFRDVVMDMDPTYETEQFGASLEFNYDWGDYRFTSLSGFYDTDANVAWDYDQFQTDVPLNYPVTFRANGEDVITTDQILSGRRQLFDRDQFTQEFRVASSYEGSFNFLLGAFYYEEDASTETRITHPALAEGARVLGLSPLYEMYRVESDPVETESFALFGEGYYDFNERTKLTVGLRYTDDNKKSRSRLILLNFAPEGWDEGEDDWQEVTGKVTLEYSITEESMVYGSFARGYKAGGLNPGGPSGGEIFDPEYINAFEIGTKNVCLDGRLQANLGAFYYDYEDMQIGQINEITTTTVNGDATVMGLESEFVFLPTDALRFDLGLAWLDFEIDDFQSADQGDPDGIAPGTTPALDENGDPRFTDDGLLIKDLEGNAVRNAPEYSVNAGAQYDLQLSAGYTVTARADYFWQDDFYANEFNKPSDKFDGWEQLDLQVTLRPAEENWHAMFFVKNAMDNDDVTRMNQEGPEVGLFRNASVLEPRTYGVEVRLSFE